MSQTQASIDIAAVIKRMIADHTSYPLIVEQDNRKVVDSTGQVNPWLKVQVKFMGAGQIDLGNTHQTVQQWGQVWLVATCLPGDGTAAVKALLDFVRPYFNVKQLGVAKLTFNAVSGGAGKEVKGLWVEPAIVDFYYHERT